MRRADDVLACVSVRTTGGRFMAKTATTPTKQPNQRERMQREAKGKRQQRRLLLGGLLAVTTIGIAIGLWAITSRVGSKPSAQALYQFHTQDVHSLAFDPERYQHALLRPPHRPEDQPRPASSRRRGMGSPTSSRPSGPRMAISAPSGSPSPSRPARSSGTRRSR